MEVTEEVRWDGVGVGEMVRVIEKPHKRETEMGANRGKGSKCRPWTSSSSITWCVLDMQILGLTPDPLNQKLGVGPIGLLF